MTGAFLSVLGLGLNTMGALILVLDSIKAANSAETAMKELKDSLLEVMKRDRDLMGLIKEVELRRTGRKTNEGFTTEELRQALEEDPWDSHVRQMLEWREEEDLVPAFWDSDLENSINNDLETLNRNVPLNPSRWFVRIGAILIILGFFLQFIAAL